MCTGQHPSLTEHWAGLSSAGPIRFSTVNSARHLHAHEERDTRASLDLDSAVASGKTERAHFWEKLQ